MKRTARAIAACVFAVAVGTSQAHEGHQPLPTKGLQFDVKTGRIVLSRAAREALDVQTVEVQTQPVAEHVSAYATVVAPWTRHAFATSRLSGRIVTLNALPGDTIEAGQVLAEIESLDLLNLRLEYQKAQNDLALSSQLLESISPVAKSGAVPGQRLIEAENTNRQNQNRLEVLRAKAAALRVSESDLSTPVENNSSPLHLPLVSPIAGIIVHADVAVGKFVEPAEHLFEIIDTSRVWVRIGVLERDLHRVQAGQTARIAFTGLPGRNFQTVIEKIDLRLDPQSHQGTAWAEIANTRANPQLLPGMNGQADLIQGSEKPALTVPRQAVLSDGAERYVLVEESSTREGSEYQKVAIVIGRQTKDRVEVLAGKILPGDRVVTRGGHELSSLFFLGVLRVSSETARSIGLKVEKVSHQTVERIMEFEGAVDVPPQRRTFASPQLTGTIREILVDRAQTVKAGEVLAQVASLELQDLQLELLQARLDAEMSRETYVRRRDAGNAISQRTVLETESRARDFEMQFASLPQKLLALRMTAEQIDGVLETRQIMDTIPVRAPIDGIVVHFDRVLGQVVRADEPLFEIHDLSQAWVQTYVGQGDSAQVQVGQPARIRFVAYPDFTGEGKVARIGPIVGTESRTQIVWVEFLESPPFTLQHNMLARVTLTVDRLSPTLAVPLASVVREGLRSFVFVQKSDGTLERRQVELGRADDRFVEIKSGLTSGEAIVTQGVSQLQTAFAAVR